MTKQVISVVGGTGLQGGGVVDALLAAGIFDVRVATRTPSSEKAKALAARGVQVVQGDLLDPASLGAFFSGAYGAFVVTNFWDPAQGSREVELGSGAIGAARAAGVKHLIWSTLPDVEKLTEGRAKVKHFTQKALLDDVARAANFARHTFVQAPFYFQNFLTALAPQPLPDGSRGWAVPIDPAARVIHAGDGSELGRAVAAAFAAGDKLPNDSTLAVCGGTYAWNDFAAALNAVGHNVRALQVPAAMFDGFFPGAAELRETFEYFVEQTYFGPDHRAHIEAANALVPGGFTRFEDWARLNMKPSA